MMNPQEIKKLEQKTLRALEPIHKKTVIAAISGGPDSIFLLYFLVQTNAKIIVAHLDHQLRTSSKKEAKFIEEQAKKHSLEYEFCTKPIATIATEQKIGIEEAGRNARYQFFNQLAEKHQAQYILTAHHADDNLETKLLNFTRGAAIDGLSGMPTFNGNLFRPLLDITKQEILSYLKAKNITYLQDESNQDTKYSRNFLRHEVIPKLKSLNPNLTSTSAKNSNLLRETADFLNQEAKTWLKQNRTHNQIPAAPFRQLHPALQRSIIHTLYKDTLGHTQNLESSHIQEVLQTITGQHGNKTKSLSGLTFYLKSGVITVEK